MVKGDKLSYLAETKKVIRESGYMGMYRGFWASAWRDVPGWAVYFYAFEYLKTYNPESSFWRTLWLLNAGGMAGVISWIASLPQDIVKTR